MHSPWRVDKDRLVGVDLSKLGTESPYLLGTAILWCALSNMVTTGNWTVGGDFNCSETFDPEWQRVNGENPTRIPGSAQMLRQICALGFIECLRKSEQEPIIPTFRHRDKTIRHQIDHLFVSNSLASTLERCSVGDEATVFGRSLSDHLPIVADFQISSEHEREHDSTTGTAGVTWAGALTYPDAPHEYLLRQSRPEIYAFYQERVAEAGRDEFFTLRGHTARYRYYYPGDGYKYWLIGDVLNRAAVN